MVAVDTGSRVLRQRETGPNSASGLPRLTWATVLIGSSTSMLPEDRRAARHGENRGRRGRRVLSGSGVVLELRKGLQRIFGGAREHHLLVFHLERTERHHDVFRAHTEET